MDRNLTWMVLDDNEFDIYDTFRAGVLTPAHVHIIPVRLYNNYLGLEKIPDLKNFGINFYFSHLEDSSLLNYIRILNKDGAELPLTRIGDTLTVNLTETVVLSGEANDGTNPKTFFDFNIEFDLPKEIKFKINDLKELNCEVVIY